MLVAFSLEERGNSRSFSFLNITQESCSGYLERGKLARMIHPLNDASNTHFFVSVSKAREETFGVTAPLAIRSYRIFASVRKKAYCGSRIQLWPVLRIGISGRRLSKREELFISARARTREASASAPAAFRLQSIGTRHSHFAIAPVQQFQTIPLWLMTFWNSSARLYPVRSPNTILFERTSCKDRKYWRRR